jgi:hypothetical protein
MEGWKRSSKNNSSVCKECFECERRKDLQKYDRVNKEPVAKRRKLDGNKNIVENSLRLESSSIDLYLRL